MSRRSHRRKSRAARAAAKPIRAAAGVGEFRAAGGLAVIARQEAGGDGRPKARTFEGNAYTGVPMKPEGFPIPIVCDLDGFVVAGTVPALRQHDHEQVVGHTAVEVTAEGVMLKDGVFSGQDEHVRKVTEPADREFPWQLSIGANPLEVSEVRAGEEVEVNGRKLTGPLLRSRRTELREVSFVPVGADGSTSASINASAGGRSMFEKVMLRAAKAAGNVRAAKYSDEEIDKMSEADAKANFKKCMAEEEPPAKAADDEKEKKEEEKEKAEAAASMKRMAAAAAAEFKAEMDRLKAVELAEHRRCSEIKARCAKYAGIDKVTVEGKVVDLIPHAIENNWTPDRAELEAMRSARPQGGAGPHFHFGTTPILDGAVLECAVFDALGDKFRLFDSDFYRVGEGGRRRVPEREEKRITAELNGRYTDQVRQAAHTHFKGRIGLQQFLTILAAANGYKGPATFNDPSGWGEVAGYLGQPIRADGPSSVNTPATLANVQNKFMLQGYMFTEQAYLKFCQVLPVKDLKPTKSVQLFGDFVFKPLNPGGEIQHASMGDNPYANQAYIQARMITLELQYLINDDLGMFGQVPMMLGRGWGLRVNDLVYTKLLSPGFDDGGTTNFFAATHTITGQSANANYQSGAGSTLTHDGLKAAKILLDRQVDPAGKKLGLDAEILLYPPELDVAAVELMNAQFIVMAGLASTSAASKQANTNIWKGRFEPVMSRYLSDSSFTGYSLTGWYLLVNPSVLPIIQIAALNGQMTPTVQTASQDWQFNQLGISSRGWGGVGVSMQNFRGGVLSAGA